MGKKKQKRISKELLKKIEFEPAPLNNNKGRLISSNVKVRRKDLKRIALGIKEK